ncbi:MAG: prepilin-type N-terminal cleavage/methylation domain-containing protein [Chitinivibrionales bacterium]|nr:prepilin-type N-terminal cleavage/methylation domain-containing protein [Chitinivibrionales bacterium]
MHRKSENRKSLYKDMSGLSLIEVMIALAIIGISVMIIMLGERNKWATFKSANKTTQAVNIIENEIERVRMDIVEDPSADWPPCASTPCCSSFTKSGINFEMCFDDALKNDGTVADNLQKVEITASWKLIGTPDTLSISTYIARDF